MELSVIIVSYNVRHFLEQCLLSVARAGSRIDHEVIVVDNNSADGSVSMVRDRFPEVKLVENRDNRGFARATNQGIIAAGGRFILVLNPDTVVDETSFETCIRFMDNNPGTGAVGLRMIDGKGRYLPESKRGLPTPSAAFWKITGINRLISSSPSVNRYYMGHLPQNEANEVEVLTGAFMFIRRSVLDKTGLFDEQFFMYGEDIDLSYRITLAGYTIFYLPSPTIIHFKGESTKRTGFNYLLNFYRSMSIFARKYFSKGEISPLLLVINLAILLRASLSVAGRAASRSFPAVADALLLLAGFLGITRAWEMLRFDSIDYYPPEMVRIMAPGIILIYFTAALAWGVYRERVKLKSILKAALSAALLVIAIYALLPSGLRYSRAVILIHSGYAAPALLLGHLIYSWLGLQRLTGVPGIRKRVIILSKLADYHKIRTLLPGNAGRLKLLGRIDPGDTMEGESLGNLEQLGEIIRINRPDEIIINSADMSTGSLISLIENSYLSETEKRIACLGSEIVIGSGSPRSKGEVYTLKLTSTG